MRRPRRPPARRRLNRGGARAECPETPRRRSTPRRVRSRRVGRRSAPIGLREPGGWCRWAGIAASWRVGKRGRHGLRRGLRLVPRAWASRRGEACWRSSPLSCSPSRRPSNAGSGGLVPIGSSRPAVQLPQRAARDVDVLPRGSTASFVSREHASARRRPTSTTRSSPVSPAS